VGGYSDLQKRFGLTLILISHSLAVVHYLCTRVLVLYLGRIVEVGDADARMEYGALHAALSHAMGRARAPESARIVRPEEDAHA